MAVPVQSMVREKGKMTGKGSKRVGAQRFSMEEVSAAGTSAKAWVAIRGKVYDVTAFADRHPGGKDFLLAASGRDATAVFESFHDPKAIKVLAKREIGILIESDMPQYPTETSFQKEVRQNVAEYFKSVGKNPRDAPGMLIPYTIGISAYFMSYYLMFSPSITRNYPLIPWLSALVHGWSSAMLGLYLQHDACHSSFTRSPMIWDIMRRAYELMTGLSSVIWIHQHVLGHHPFTNVMDLDPDIIQTNPGPVRIHESQPWWSYYALQSYYWIPLYSQLVFSRRASEWHNLFVDRKFKSISINPLPAKEYAYGLLALTSFLTLHILIPSTLLSHSLPRIIALYALCDAFWSLYLMLVFQASHVNDEVAWPKADAQSQMDDWAKLQIESSMDFAHGSTLTTFLVGSLNYQAVHHLFPHISQYYYPALAPIVMATCQKHGVAYNVRGSLYEALALHIGRLVNLGKEPVDDKVEGKVDVAVLEPADEGYVSDEKKNEEVVCVTRASGVDIQK